MRILGITIPDNKRLEVALTALYGIGYTKARAALSEAGVEYDKRAKDLTSEEEAAIRKQIEGDRLEGDLRREVSGNIKRLKDIGCYRGLMHTRGLPTRGQRSKTNSRTRRGNVRKTMGTGRRKEAKK